MSDERLGPFGQVKWQRKFLSSDQTSDGTMGDLTFSNLTVGRTYIIGGLVRMSVNSGGVDVAVSLDVTHNSVVIERKQFINRQTDSTAGDTSTYGVHKIFVAAATSLTFVAASASANALISGDGTQTQTHIELYELPAAEEVSTW